MQRLIFTIYIDIPNEKLDNPASWNNETGKQLESNKSKNTKKKLALWKDRLISKQKKYAELCGASYQVFSDNDKMYRWFSQWFYKNAPQISEYDIINFYKHYLMYNLSIVYDEICYLDLDVVPLSDKNLFEEFDMFKFHVGESNAESMWGRNIQLKWYNACIRNPASKFFNSQAMAYEADIEPPIDVFNTGIMFSRHNVIQQLNYFENFQNNLKMMTRLKEDKNSMYPLEIRRSFGYDNETLFAHRVGMTKMPYETLPIEWNTTDLRPKSLDKAELVHVISKDFRHVL